MIFFAVSIKVIFFLPVVGCRAGDQPRCHQSSGNSPAKAVTHVCRGAGQVTAGQHAGRFIGGYPPQGYPEDIRRQGPRHHRRPEEKPCCFCPHRLKEVGTYTAMAFLLVAHNTNNTAVVLLLIRNLDFILSLSSVHLCPCWCVLSSVCIVV